MINKTADFSFVMNRIYCFYKGTINTNYWHRTNYIHLTVTHEMSEDFQTLDNVDTEDDNADVCCAWNKVTYKQWLSSDGYQA